MKMDADTVILPADFPELSLLLWNRDVSTPIAAREAFAIYERNWRFVDAARLTGKERVLIDSLIRVFGNGVMLAS